MPVTFTRTTTIPEDAREEVSFLDESGELTLPAGTVSDFLTHCDCEAVFEHADAAPHITPVAESEDEEASEVMPGWAAAQVVDEDDLVESFGHYLDALPESSLEEKAVLAAWNAFIGEEDLDEKKKPPFKKGGFKRLGKQPKGRNKVSRMILAMLHKGVIKRDAKNPGKYKKDKGYRKGGTKGGNVKLAKYKKANKSSVKAAARKAKQKLESSEAEGLPVFGHALPVAIGEQHAIFTLGVCAESEIVVSAALAEMYKKGKKDMKGMKYGKDYDKGKMDKDDDDDDDDMKDESKSVSESVRLAGSVVAQVSPTLVEDVPAS